MGREAPPPVTARAAPLWRAYRHAVLELLRVEAAPPRSIPQTGSALSRELELGRLLRHNRASPAVLTLRTIAMPLFSARFSHSPACGIHPDRPPQVT
jgi:hypothetical protein